MASHFLLKPPISLIEKNSISDEADTLASRTGDGHMLKIKRAYEPPSRTDGFRVLIERLWPRGITKERADLDLWLKDAAPSTELRKWFHADPESRWKEFQRRYAAELRSHPEATDFLRRKAQARTVTLIYATKDEEHNTAVALKKILEAGTHRRA